MGSPTLTICSFLHLYKQTICYCPDGNSLRLENVPAGNLLAGKGLLAGRLDGPFPVWVPSGLIDALVEVHLRLILQEGWGEAVPVLWIKKKMPCDEIQLHCSPNCALFFSQTYSCTSFFFANHVCHRSPWMCSNMKKHYSIPEQRTPEKIIHLS